MKKVATLNLTLKLSSVAFLFALSAWAQNSSPAAGDQQNPSKGLTPAHGRGRTETSVSLGAAAQLTTDRISPAQSLDPSAAILGTIRQSFRPFVGYSIDFGYTRTTSHNAYGNGSFAIPANMYEVSLAYLAQTHITSKLSGFVDLGGGMVSFLPVHRGVDATKYVPGGSTGLVPPVEFRPLGVSGIGINYHYTPHIALRAEYRGLLYKYPDYGIGLGRSVTLSSQPTLSVTYSFGKSH